MRLYSVLIQFSWVNLNLSKKNQSQVLLENQKDLKVFVFLIEVFRKKKHIIFFLFPCVH